jgi:hypothetical protein
VRNKYSIQILIVVVVDFLRYINHITDSFIAHIKSVFSLMMRLGLKEPVSHINSFTIFALRCTVRITQLEQSLGLLMSGFTMRGTPRAGLNF